VSEAKLKLRWTFGGSGAFFRFYGELSDFLPPARRGRLLLHRFDVSPSVKAAIEGFGVPHPEVGLIVVIARRSISRTRWARVISSAYTRVSFHRCELAHRAPPAARRHAAIRSRRSSRPPCRLSSPHGLDALYRNHASDEELAREAAGGARVLLTRDRGLLKRNDVVHGYWLRNTEPRRQLLEVTRRFDLIRHADLFTRCLVCNTVLDIVDKATVAAEMPERAREQFDDLRRCPGCARVYWKGSHYRRMLHMVGRILRAARR